MTIVHPLTGCVVLTAIVLSACSPSGEIIQPKFEAITLIDADLRGMVVDRRTDNAEPRCLYVADAKQDRIHCVNLKTHELDTAAAIRLGLGTMPVALALSRATQRLFVGSGKPTGGSLLEIDLSNGNSIELLPFSDPEVEVVENLAVLNNDQVVIGLRALGTQKARIVYWPSAVQGGPAANENVRLIAAHNDGTLFATADAASASPKSPNIKLWRAGKTAIEQIASGNYFGFGTQALPSIVFHPVQHDFYGLTDGGGLPSTIPAYRLTDVDTVEALPIQFTANYPAVALAFSANSRRVLVAHDTRPTPGYRYDPNHDLSVPDLHVFDVDTGVETGVITLPDHVHDGGIAVAPDETIYLLLGRPTASSMGMIRDPGN